MMSYDAGDDALRRVTEESNSIDDDARMVSVSVSITSMNIEYC